MKGAITSAGQESVSEPQQRLVGKQWEPPSEHVPSEHATAAVHAQAEEEFPAAEGPQHVNSKEGVTLCPQPYRFE